MNNLKRLAITFVAATALFIGFSVSFPSIKADAEQSSGQIVTEVYSGRVLYGENVDTCMPMASTTKILTAIIIIEDCNLEDVVKIPAEAAGAEGSSVYLKKDEEFTVRQLLYGLMLRSGNDCAAALAIEHSGSIKAFAEEMNVRAKKMGAVNSRFENPSGLPNDNHYTTAYDLAMIASYALKNETFAEIVSTKYFKELGWKNKNKMLFNYEGANGVKTGYTIKAGRCLVTSAERGGMWLVCAVLNCPDMYERSATLLNDAFNEYSYECVYGDEEEELSSDVKGKSVIGSTKKRLFYPLRKEELSYIKIEKSLPDKVKLPVKAGEKVGNIKIYFANQLIFSENLCSILDVDKSYSDILREIAERALRK